MKKMDNKGFSLVELIIVIAIMAILVGVLAPQFIKYVEQSRQSSDLQSIEEIKTAIETWTADSGTSSATSTVAASGKKAIVSGKALGELSSYGVSDTTGLKSSRVNVTWTYDHGTFTWSCADNMASDTTCYYDGYGNKKANN